MCGGLDSGLAAAVGSTLPAYNSAGWLTVRFMLLSVRGVFVRCGFLAGAVRDGTRHERISMTRLKRLLAAIVLAFMAAGAVCTEYRSAQLAQVWADLCPFQVLP